jgi:hypothetical protein
MVVRPDWHPIPEECDDCHISLVIAEARHDGNPHDFPAVACFGCFTTLREATEEEIAQITTDEDFHVGRK